MREARIDHGPHASVKAWLLAAWLVRFLGGRVMAGKATPGVEMSWRCQLPHGEALVRLHRLEQGPPTVERVRLGCDLDGKPGALLLARDGPNRLSMEVEGADTSARTVTVAGISALDLIGRQLSDRERDPAFHESMALAGTMAQGLLR